MDWDDDWEQDTSPKSDTNNNVHSEPKSDSLYNGFNSKAGSVNSRPGDWACPSCSANNFSNKTQCFKCSEPKPEGLSSSNNFRSGGGSSRPGDWSCPSCSANNFSNKIECFKCSEPKPEGLSSSNNFRSGSASSRPGDWSCPSCSANNFSNKIECFKCSEPKPEGLSSSNNFRSGSGSSRPGDWSCPSCSANNFSNKTACFKCSEPKPEGLGNSSSNDTNSRPGDWACPSCSANNFSNKTECFKCSEPKPEGLPDGKPGPVTYVPPEEDESKIFEQTHKGGINFDAYDRIPVKVTGDRLVPQISSFDEAQLTPGVRQNVEKAKYFKPTPVQKYAIPFVNAGRDLMACAQTGSGKTAAFVLPILSGIMKDNVACSELSSVQTPQAIVVEPVRELAIQVNKEFCKLAHGTVMRSRCIYGGVSVGYQKSQISKGSNIVVATIGRLMQFLRDGLLSLARVKYLVLDEADRMLDQGFRPEIVSLCSSFDLPDKNNRTTLMFSATFDSDVQSIAATILKEDYIFLAVGNVGGANSDVTQTILEVADSAKNAKIKEIIDPFEKTLVFVERKKKADFLALQLSGHGLKTTSIHGDRAQAEREEALRDFTRGSCPVMVATGVAARGLDITGVNHVINYDLPNSIDEYTHRIGRTGRIGTKGKATSFYSAATDSSLARSLVQKLSEVCQEVPDWLDASASGAYGSSSGVKSGNFGGYDVRKSQNSQTQQSSSIGVSYVNDDDEDW